MELKADFTQLINKLLYSENGKFNENFIDLIVENFHQSLIHAPLGEHHINEIYNKLNALKFD